MKYNIDLYIVTKDSFQIYFQAFYSVSKNLTKYKQNYRKFYKNKTEGSRVHDIDQKSEYEIFFTVA